MIKKIKQLVTTLSLALTLMTPTLAVGVVGAAGITEGFCKGSNQAATGTGDTTCQASGSDDRLNNIVNWIVDTFSWLVGIVSVIMIVYGGFRYVTSGGDSGKITTAKNSIIYAIIGLVIVAAAQFIVNFVVAKTQGQTT
jgi:hypothetical protein